MSEPTITERALAELHRRDAKTPKLRWPETWDEAIEWHAEWLLQHALDLLDYTQLDACAQVSPESALKYAPGRLYPSRREWCIGSNPTAALKYATGFLTVTQLDDIAEGWPYLALQHASALLSPERLTYCAVRHPLHALRYARYRLTLECEEVCEKKVAEYKKENDRW